MTPADRRISELIDKWLASIDLHLKYVELSDAAYARVQAWPKHDRPTRWVLEVARQKILELKAQCETRQAMGDGKFSESLELMAFLANLVGLSVVRELGPLMTAILVTGRSGAAYAAELGTMTVNEEIDALRTLGQDPQRFLLFPRVLTLLIVLPVLTLVADVIGCLGGLALPHQRGVIGCGRGAGGTDGWIPPVERADGMGGGRSRSHEARQQR